MTESKDSKPLTLRSGTLELKKKVGPSTVRQNFSHGRSKTVTVEVRRKRTFTPDGREDHAAAEIDEEKSHRLKVLQDAQKADEEEAKRKAEEDAERARIEAEEAKKAEEEAAKKADEPEEKPEEKPAEKEPKPAKVKKEEKKEDPEEVARKAQEAAAALAAAEAKKEMGGEQRHAPSDDKRHKKDVKPEPRQTVRRGEPKRRSGKLTISAALDGNDRYERGRSMASLRRAKEKERKRMMAANKPAEKLYREVTIPETITVHDLSVRMTEKGADVIKVLMKMGVMATINQTIDADTAELVVEEMGHKARRVAEADIEDGLKTLEDKDEDCLPRPPVVTVMGHVDHGKTSLLDALRSTDVAEGEAGGITQHIGAYQVTVASGEKVTFIDTPGHAAFTEMRARGAQVTDIVILVVAADDGVMPQTIEAIRHAKAAEVPIVVAVNKIDKPGADPQRVKTELLSHEIFIEEMGGETLCVEVSAKERMNLDKLVDAVLLQSEVLDLKANPNRSAEGVIVEAKMEQGRGSVATVLVQKGTLQVGDIFVCGQEWGRVRAMQTEQGKKTKAAIPAFPVEVQGLQGTPHAGDDFVVVDTEARAREVSDYRKRKYRESLNVKSAKTLVEQMFDKIKAGETKELPIVLKGDVQGSIEAILGTLNKMSNEEVKISALHTAVGGINESDITLAKASGALVIGFNVRANPQARDLARRDGVDIRYYSIIYDVADDMKKALEGMLSPELKEKFIGYAEIREVFSISKVGKVAGCMVTEGIVKRGAKVRLLRDNVVIHEGSLSQLKRFKDDAREVREGYECGMSFENYNDIQQGDMIECFEIEEIAATLKDADQK